MNKLQEQEIETFEPFVKRTKMPKGKGFALFAGGAAIGATGMHLYHKSGNSQAAGNSKYILTGAHKQF